MRRDEISKPSRSPSRVVWQRTLRVAISIFLGFGILFTIWISYRAQSVWRATIWMLIPHLVLIAVLIRSVTISRLALLLGGTVFVVAWGFYKYLDAIILRPSGFGGVVFVEVPLLQAVIAAIVALVGRWRSTAFLICLLGGCSLYYLSLGPALYFSGVKTSDVYAKPPLAIRILYYPIIELGAQPGFYDGYLRFWTDKNTTSSDDA